MENNLEKRFKPGETRELTDEEVYETIIKPIEEARKTGIFDYLHRLRCESNHSDFVFDSYAA